jgi:tRNA threonylcarbamoyladenosine biosynthesis protein TsaB
MAALSFEKFKNNDFVDVAYFEPYYLKDFMVTKSTK